MANESTILLALKALIDESNAIQSYAQAEFGRAMACEILLSEDEFNQPGANDWPICYLQMGESELTDEMNTVGEWTQPLMCTVYVEATDKDEKLRRISELLALFNTLFYANGTAGGATDIHIETSWADSELFAELNDPNAVAKVINMQCMYRP